MYSFTSIHSQAKKLYLRMFDLVDTTFSYEIELIVCSFLQDFTKGKGSNVCNPGLQLMCNAHTAFLLCGAAEVLLPLKINTSFRQGHGLLNIFDSKTMEFVFPWQKNQLKRGCSLCDVIWWNIWIYIIY